MVYFCLKNVEYWHYCQNSDAGIYVFSQSSVIAWVNRTIRKSSWFAQTLNAEDMFLGGLSLHLNHLIASRMANYNWPFGTLPFGLFGSNLDTRDLETYSRPYSGHFWNMSLFDDSRAIWVLFRKWVVFENCILLRNGWPTPGYSDLVLGGEVPRLNHGPIYFPIQNTWGGAMGCWKSSTTFLTLSWRIKAHLLLMYCIKNQSIGVS